MLTLGVACYKRYDLLVEMIRSAQNGDRPPDRFFLVDNGCRANADSLPPNTTIFRPGRNIGVAAAVNAVFRENQDLTIWTNDDVLFEKNTLAALEATALEDPDRLFCLPRRNAGSAFTVFLARRALFERVGWFDERFFPAYFEDNDFAYRMNLAGIQRQLVDASYHHFTSSTMAAYSADEMNEHHARFEANRRLYTQKWGGPPDCETFREPRA